MGSTVSALKSQQVTQVEGQISDSAVIAETKTHPSANQMLHGTVNEEDIEPEELARIIRQQKRSVQNESIQNQSSQLSLSAELMTEFQNEVAAGTMASIFLQKRKLVKNAFKYDEFESLRRVYNRDLVAKQMAKISRSQNQAKLDNEGASSSFTRIHKAISDLEGWGPGLRISFQDGDWRITGISKNSGASASGIFVNDKLKIVDGHDVSKKTFEEIRSLLLGPKDSNVVVAVSKNFLFRRFNQPYVLSRSLPSASFDFSSTLVAQKTMIHAQVEEQNEAEAFILENKQKLLSKQKMRADEEAFLSEQQATTSLLNDFVIAPLLDNATVSIVHDTIINHVKNMGIPSFLVSIHNRSMRGELATLSFQLADHLSMVMRTFSVEPVVNVIDGYLKNGAMFKSTWRSSIEQGVSTNGIPVCVLIWELQHWNAWQQWMKRHHARMTETKRSLGAYKKQLLNLDDEDFIQEAVHIFSSKHAACVARIFVHVEDTIEPSSLVDVIDTSFMRELFHTEIPQVVFIYQKQVQIQLNILQRISYSSVKSFFQNTKHACSQYFVNLLTLFLKSVSNVISSILDCGPDIRKILCDGTSVITSKFVPNKQLCFSSEQIVSSYESLTEQRLLKQPQHFILYSMIHDWENNPMSSKPGKKMFFFTPELCGFSSVLDWIYESLRASPAGLDDIVPILVRVPQYFQETGLAESKSLIFALYTTVIATLSNPPFNFVSQQDSHVDVSSESTEHLMEILAKLLSVACKQLCVKFLIMVDNIHYVKFDTDSMGCMQWTLSRMPENVRFVFSFLLNSPMQRSLKTYVHSVQEKTPAGNLDIELLEGLEYRRIPLFTSHQRQFFGCFVRSGTACQVLAEKLCEDYFAWYLHVNPNMDSHIWLLIATGYVMVHHLWNIGVKPIEMFFPSDLKSLTLSIVQDFSTILSGCMMLTVVRIMSAARFGITMTEIIKIMMILSGHRDKVFQHNVEYHQSCQIIFENSGHAQIIQRFCCIFARMEGCGFCTSALLLLNSKVHQLLEEVILDLHGPLPEVLSTERMQHVIFELLQFSCNVQQISVSSSDAARGFTGSRSIPSQLRHLLIITDFALYIREKKAFLFALSSIRILHARIVMGCVHWVIGNILQALRKADGFDESDLSMISLLFRSLICHKSRSAILEIQPDLYFSIMSATPSKEYICHESFDILENFREPWLRHSNKIQYFQFPIINLADLPFSATALATTKRGHLVAAGDFSGKLAVWRVSSSDLLCIFSSHSQAITAVVFSSLDYVIISCSSDCSINVNSVYSSSVLTTIMPHSQPITCLDIWPKDSDRFASVSRDGLAAVATLNLRAIAARSTAWKAVKDGNTQTEFTDEELGTLLLQPSFSVFTFRVVSFDVLADNLHTNFVDCIACHPSDNSICATGSRDASIFVWKVDFVNSSSICLFRYLGHSHWILSLDWLQAGYTILSSSMSSAIHIWRVPYEHHVEQPIEQRALNDAVQTASSMTQNEGECDDLIGDGVSSRLSNRKFTSGISVVQNSDPFPISTYDSDEFSEFDGVRMFIEREEREITLGSYTLASSDKESGHTSNFKYYPCRTLLSFGFVKHNISFRSDPSVVEQGVAITYTPCHVALLALNLTDSSFPWQTKDRTKQFASSVRFLGSESMWLLSIENISLTYNAKDHILTSLFRGHSDKINSVAFNPLLDVFFTASSDKFIKAWDISRAPEFKLLEHSSLSKITIFVVGHQEIDPFSDSMDCTFFFGCSDGSLGANKCCKKSSLDPMTSTDYSLSNASSKHDYGISSLAYFRSYKSSFPEIVASGDDNGGVKLWDAGELKHLRTLLTTHPNPIVASRFFLPDVAIGEDLFLNLFTMTGDAFCVVWDAESGTALRFVMLPISSISRVQMCSNCSLSALGHTGSSSFTLFDYVTLANLGLLKPQFFASENASVRSLTLSIHGERCAVGSSTGDICLMETHSRQIIAVGKHHKKEVDILLWTRFMDRLVSSSADKTMAFWDGGMVPYSDELESSLDAFAVFAPIVFHKLDARLTVIQECTTIPCKSASDVQV